MKVNNPFVIRGYAGPEYFCDRENETKRLVSALRNERDVTLMAPRRYGKTGLIRNVFNQIKHECAVVYLDIYSTRNLTEFTRSFASSVISALDTKGERLMADIARFFKNCRPTVTPQESGMPTFSFELASSE